MGSRVALFVGKGAENNAGGFGLGSFALRQTRARSRPGLCLASYGGSLLRLNNGRGFGLGFARPADDAAFDLLDDDLLAAAVTEALTHDARLGAWLERQRLAGNA